MKDTVARLRRHRRNLATAMTVVISAVAATWIVPAVAQEEPRPPPVELTEPPRYEERPGEARLALQPEERREALEEIVVVGGGMWRLPDLGSSLRVQREVEQATGRLATSFLPLYDPESPAHHRDLLSNDTELHRVGFIELFRVRFGGRRGRD